MNINIDMLKRNIKLQELGIEKLSDREQEILDFLHEHLKDLNTYTSDKYLTDLFFGKDTDNVILNYNKGNKHLFVERDKIWSLFESTFNMGYIEIQELMKWWVGDTLQLNVNNPDILPVNTIPVGDILYLKLNNTLPL